MKRRVRLMAVWMLCVLLIGCRGYTDASVAIPTGWAAYAAGPLDFQFEAGWTEADADVIGEGIAGGVSIFDDASSAVLIQAYESPTREQGTHDYLVLSVYTMDRPTTAEDLESLMDPLNAMSRSIKNQAGLATEIEQNARIRHYGGIDALSICCRLENDQVQSMIQLALIPDGTQVYQIAYCDFTRIKDDSTLEAILSSLEINS